MYACGNSFFNYGDSASCGIQNPEITTRLGDKLTWGWSGIQTVGNAL